MGIRAALVLDPLDEALAVPGVRERIMQLGGDWREQPIPAPSREELVELANG